MKLTMRRPVPTPRSPWLGALLLCATACDQRAPRPATSAPPPMPPAASTAAPPALPPLPATAAAPAEVEPSAAREPPALEAAEPLIELPVEGFGAAVVSLPRGARGKRPVVLATHGNYDLPEWQCVVWRGIVGDAAFILCPRGVPRPDSPSPSDIRFTYASNQALEREIDAGIAALRARFPLFVDDERPLYTGFSLGAIMGVSIAARAPARYPRMVLIEGGHDKWTQEAARVYAAGGGQGAGGERRVLFVCSQGYCGGDARRAAARLSKAGAVASVVSGPNVGHRYDGPIAEAARKALPWVLEGDARWEGLLEGSGR